MQSVPDGQYGAGKNSIYNQFPPEDVAFNKARYPLVSQSGQQMDALRASRAGRLQDATKSNDDKAKLQTQAEGNKVKIAQMEIDARANLKASGDNRLENEANSKNFKDLVQTGLNNAAKKGLSAEDPDVRNQIIRDAVMGLSAPRQQSNSTSGGNGTSGQGNAPAQSPSNAPGGQIQVHNGFIYKMGPDGQYHKQGPAQ
jgi:hypothetical protein